MVRILVKTAWRFVKPVGGALTKPKPGETPEEAAQRVNQDNAERIRRASHHNRDHFFDARPGEVVEAPDWIKDTEEWVMGRADGSIEELVPKSASAAMPDNPAAAGETLADGDEEENEEEEETDESEENSEESEEEPLPAGETEAGAPPGATRRTIVGKKKAKKKGS